MGIEKNKLVSIEYTVKDDQGEVLDTSEGRAPLSFVQGLGSIIPGLERALEGRDKGDELSVTIESQDAYGEHDPSLIQVVSRTVFEGIEEISEGMRFNAQTSEGPRAILITKVEGDQVTIDANHPLAGKQLHFEVRVCDVRAATEEEIAFANGVCNQAHGCSGCSGCS